jgi:SCY1-like protein 2
MSVIRKLGERVEKEHNQFLRDSQRIEDRSATANGVASPNLNTGVDFESLVGRANATVKPDTVMDSSTSWDDDVWGSIFNNTPEVGFA